jgi:hypothetical protein
MTQVGHTIQIARKWESVESLKKHLHSVMNTSRLPYVVKELIAEFPQTTTDAVASLEEVAGETIAAMSASKVLNAATKADVEADRSQAGTVEWQSATGALTTATFTTHAENSSTRVAMVAPVSTARFIRSVSFAKDLGAQDLVISNAGGDEIFAAIKTGQHQLLKANLRAVPTYRTFIGSLKVDLTLTTAVVTLVCTFTPVGETLSVTKTFTTKEPTKTWEIALEVAAGTDITWTIEDDNAAHPVATTTITYVEAY